MPPQQVKSFTARCDRTVSILTSPVKISAKFDPATPKFDFSKSRNTDDDFNALWDTGATNSVITPKVIQRLNLQYIGFTTVSGVHGIQKVKAYCVCMYLPNGIFVDGIRVTEGNISGADVLIGMDIISKGDFAVTNHKKTTVFSFQVPSVGEIDFTQRVQTPNQPFLATRAPGRNEPCLCGSGKKYKRCCGKA